ncbi:MAG: citryl-CoA lyase [Rhodocyclales bacterium RIFCSPLOWO2_02_FULL_63_24]|nr:MAG: citryl-CoA lyase [Rhodocyclales bacterium RIFCSPLOWO2_02_FULL_63_24]
MSDTVPEQRLSDVDPADVVHTRIWREDAEADNPFATRAAYCRGYDVFGQMVGRARWVEMLFLLFRDDLPGDSALDAIEALAVALANPGPRDPSIHAAMCGGVGGSSAAASLIAALSVGAGRYRGARDVFDAMTAWRRCGTDIEAWLAHVRRDTCNDVEIWPAREHPAGFDPHGVSMTTPVKQLLGTLAGIANTPRLNWLTQHRQEMEAAIGFPLDISGVAAAALADLEFTPAEGEMLYLLLRLPGAAAHALEQEKLGYKRFPFYPVELEDDPANKEST